MFANYRSLVRTGSEVNDLQWDCLNPFRKAPPRVSLQHNMKYRVEYEFLRGTSIAETARRNNNVYSGGVVKENTVRFRFKRFRSGHFDPQNQPRGRLETKVNTG
ncbi:jg6043 [Pararge aegeria aegeria]|uniref:Jg6043 protein n=1 Tax=Pararge aegeria aegeria TaxID=348720 RepID=A0A8S4QCA1_9NEOP|nr:jg6043 [Pararge aegeria aegeria]